jgi:hypothetical protein
MKYHKIEIDNEVMNFLKKNAEPFIDTPNTVLRRLLLKDNNRSNTVYELPTFPYGIPKTLEEILEVIYLVVKHGLSRNHATFIVAKKRSIAKQTVIDKYCRQLNKKAFEIDALLQPQRLSDFKLLLKNKFNNYKSVIDNFFSAIE